MPAKMNHYDAALRLCVDRAENGQVQGRIVSRRLTAPIPFTDIGNLILQVEEILNQQNFPQAFQRTRTFRHVPPHAIPVSQDLSSGMSSEEVEAAHGAVDTFSLFVLTRRSTTWQGKLDYLDGSAPASFSSVLELIKMIDERLFPRT